MDRAVEGRVGKGRAEWQCRAGKSRGSQARKDPGRAGQNGRVRQGRVEEGIRSGKGRMAG